MAILILILILIYVNYIYVYKILLCIFFMRNKSVTRVSCECGKKRVEVIAQPLCHNTDLSGIAGNVGEVREIDVIL